MIRRSIEPVVRRLASKYPVMTVTGPRQSGKTTLCRAAFPKKPYVNLESPDVRRFASEDPRSFLSQFPRGAVIDEIQRAPELPSYIQPIVDESKSPGMFILTGSGQFEVIERVNQSLAGRTALVKLLPFSIDEAGGKFSADEFIFKGFYPRIYDRKLNPTQALADYFETYVERDVRQAVNVKDLRTFEKFVKLCAGIVGQLLNMHSIATDAGISHTTAASWISVLEASYVIFLLPPFHANIGKRLTKSPKLYFVDVGLAAYLLGIEDKRHVAAHPLRGNLFENLAVLEILKHRFNAGKKSNLTFFRDSSGTEIDVVVESGAEMSAIEIKSGGTVTEDYFRNLRIFRKLFGKAAKRAAVIYSGNRAEKRSDIVVSPVQKIHNLLKEFKVS